MPKTRTIGSTTCYQQRGAEVFKDGRNSIILGLNDIKVGDQVCVPTLFGYQKMTVSEINDDEGTAENESTIAPLNFGLDSRNCWTSEMAMNKKALDRLKL